MVVTPFLFFFSWLEDVPDFLIGHNVNLWMTQAALVSGEVQREGVPVEQPGTLHAFLVMLASSSCSAPPRSGYFNAETSQEKRELMAEMRAAPRRRMTGYRKGGR